MFTQSKLRILFAALTTLSLVLSPVSAFAATSVGHTTSTGSVHQFTTKRVYLTSGTSWSVPSDWNSGLNTIEVIGGGGGGVSGTAARAGGGGGGGYSQAKNVTLTPGASAAYAVGSGGAANTAGGATYFCNSTSNCAGIGGSAVVVGANGGAAGSTITGGAGGSITGAVGSLLYAGGNGGNGHNSSQNDAGGGGGAAGPLGAGATGGDGGPSNTDSGGGGGGGNGGGSAGAVGTAGNGGNGGNNAGGTGSGTGSTQTPSAASVAGTNGGGGGGGINGGGSATGKSGGAGTEWDVTHGSGGGGGGGSSTSGGTGGAGALYGAGGAGSVTGGAGAQGIIVITYVADTIVANAANQLSQGLVGYWPLDGGITNWSTGQTLDVSGNANTGQMSGLSAAASVIAGKFGQALRFNGSSSYISLPTSVIPALALTYSAWAKLSSAPPTEGVVIGLSYNPYNKLSIINTGARFTVQTDTGVKDIDALFTPKAGVWYFLVGTYDGAAMKLYVNGVLAGTVAWAGTSLNTGGQIPTIGCAGTACAGGSYFPGTIDDARIYNYALASIDVTRLFGAGSATINKAKRIFLTSGTSWSVPADWNSTNNSIEVIGGGGGGDVYAASNGARAGGGGGAYAKISNLSLTPGASVTYKVGAGGGTAAAGSDTYFNGTGTTCAVQSVCAKGGGGGSGATAGAGGSAGSSVGTIKYSGGSGGAGATATNFGGSGGGGAGGPLGAGGTGGLGGPNIGGGGGGNGGGTNGAAGNTSTGGKNAAGGGAGAAGTSGSSGTNGTGGMAGGGGGGGGGGTPPGAGGAGGAGAEWDATHGSGGGGGGRGDQSGNSNTTVNSGSGGLYGGGGAGNGADPGTGTPGAGAPGIVVITYVPVINLAGQAKQTTIGVSKPSLVGGGLAGYWPFDGKTINWATGAVGDLSGNSVTGHMVTMSTSSSPVAGKIGQALRFNGATQYVSVSGNPTTAVDNWTMSAWINPSVLPQRAASNFPGMVMYNGNDSGGYGFGVGAAGVTGSKLMGLYGSVSWLDSGYTFPSANKWYYVTMMRRAGSVSFYVNGVQTSNTFASVPNAVQSGFAIGLEPASPSDSYFIGSIDDARIYSRALTAQDVNALYTSGK